MDEAFYQKLIERYLQGKCTDEELEVFARLTEQGKLDQYLLAAMNKDAGIGTEEGADLNQEPVPIKKISVFWMRRAVAAAIILSLSIGWLWYHHNNISIHLIAGSGPGNDRAPGGNKAILTLANGSKLVLDSAHDGRLANQGTTIVQKIHDGQLQYQAGNGTNDQSEIAYNNITTPAGGQYELVLSDGTKVWLNSLSSLRYPTAFNGSSRSVELTGEAYFEVAKNAAMPFRVSSNGQTVEVLGTHFNINAYRDEPAITTTLLEGKVRVCKDARSAVLAAGDQSLTGDHGLTLVHHADTEAAVAWEHGYFQFNNADIQTIMRQVSRWYDVQVEYATPAKERRFTGSISRSVHISSVLTMLKYAGIQAVMQGDKIIISL